MKKLLLFFSLFLISISLSACKKGNDTSGPVDQIKAEHSFYDEDISSMIKFIGNPVKKNATDDYYTPKYSITAYMRIKNGTSRQLDYYQFDWVYNDNSHSKYYHYAKNEYQTSIIRTFAQRFLPPSYINKNSIEEVNGLIKYSFILENELHNKEYSFSESIFKLSANEFDNYGNNNKNEHLEVNIDCVDNIEEDYYRFKLSFNVLNQEEEFHVDIQSWILTENNQIIPFIGLYNYTENNPDYELVTDEKVFKYVNIKNIFIKCVKTNNNNEEVELLYNLPFNR